MSNVSSLFNLREISEQLNHYSYVASPPSSEMALAGRFFGDMDDHLRECKFHNGFVIVKNKDLVMDYSTPSHNLEQYQGEVILLLCSCGWEVPVNSLVYGICYRGCEFEDVISNINYNLIHKKGPIRFEDEVERVLEFYKKSEKKKMKIIHKKAVKRFSKPLAGLEI